MRIVPTLVLLAAAACGGEEGAVLTFDAPDAMTATRIEIVLASAAPEAISKLGNQRVRPGELGEEAVVYYRQRARGGAVQTAESLDGFQIRIEPDVEQADDERFIPFVLVYDGDALIGIGAVDDGTARPAEVTIRPDVIAHYAVRIEAMGAASDVDGLAAGTSQVIRCGDTEAQAWTSGVAWRPSAGPQLRLLLPDLGADANATDATQRAPDLDCDRHAAWDDDCDDLRRAFHAGQVEACDGLDTDCDGARFEVIEGCTATTSCNGAEAVSLCMDEGTPIDRGCMPGAACLCAAQATGCTRCVLGYVGAAGALTKTPCAPAVGKLHPLDCTDCSVEVVAVDAPWKVSLSNLEVGPWSSSISGVSGGYFVRVELAEGNTIDLPLGSVGEAYLAISQAGAVDVVSIDLEIYDDPLGQCEVTASGDAPMICSP